MRFVKLGLISIIIFSLIVILFSFLLPSAIRVSRAIEIQEGAAVVKKELRELDNWRRWNLMLNNPDLQNVQIDGNKFESDDLTIELKLGDPIRSIWIRQNGKQIPSGFNIISSSSDFTLVQWYFDFHLNWYPWEKFGSMVFDRQLGPVMEKSLDNFKKIVEDSL